MPSPLTAVIPLKALATAKGRLAPELDPERRRALAIAMFTHVAQTLRGAPEVADVLVVAGDADAAALAEDLGVRAMVPPRPGLHGALNCADAALGSMPSLIVAADLPLLEAADVTALVAASGREKAVVIAPTRDGGTGALLRRPGDVMGTAFGPGSAAAHRTLAAEAGVSAVLLDRIGLANDVDTVRQLHALGPLGERLSGWSVAG
jgi:2-phospho-L-lactate guanylyltransferase